MKTISFKIDISDEHLHRILDEDSRIYSSMMRFAFNRYKESHSYKEIYSILGQIFSKCKITLQKLCSKIGRNPVFTEQGQ